MSAPIQADQVVEATFRAISPNREEAERYLDLLDNEADTWTFQTFDDMKGRKDSRLALVLNGTLGEHWETLVRLNQGGAGVFVTVNETDGTGRKKENIIRVRAIWQEQDDDGCPELPVQPHITVESSPGKHHNYVLVKNVPLDDFQGLQACMVESYGSDPNAKDLSRVLRLPGFYHQKDPSSPHMVRIVCQSDEPPLNYEKAKVFFPPVVRLAIIPTAQGDLPDDIDLEEIESALYALDPDIEYNQWLNIGMALHDATSGAAEGLRLWDSWSNDGKKYVEGECESKWQSFNGGGITIATLFKMAIKEDWQWDYQTSCSNDPEDWEPPVPLDRPDLPQFDQNDFPSCLWSMICAVANAKETPVELGATIALAVVATATQRKVEVEVTPGYREPMNLYCCAIMPPGARKSATLKEFIEPLQAWERQQATMLQPKIEAASIQREIEELRLKELQKRQAKEDSYEKREEVLQRIEEVTQNRTDIPVVPRLLAGDITPEHLGTLMTENEEKMAIISTEGGIFETIGGRYSRGTPNLDLVLQGHSGDHVRVDRGSRQPVSMERPALTMGLMVQPDVIQGMASKPGFRGRGLIGRFLFVRPEDNIGGRTGKSEPIPGAVKFAYHQTILSLLDIPVSEEVQTIKPTVEAQEVWQEFWKMIEGKMAADGIFEHMRDFAGKLPGAAARIAGNFHCVENCESSKPWQKELERDTMQRAVSLATKLGQYALFVYDQMGADESILAARKILQWIRRQGAETFTARDCHAALKGRFQKRAELEPGFNILIDYGYIVPVERIKKRGRPSDKFRVNPFTHR